MHQFFVLVAISLFAVSQGGTRARQTECQRHKEEMERSTAPVRWEINCDANGDYAPLQCTYDTPKWCTCYDKEGDVLVQPSRKVTTCDCVIAKRNKENSSAPECEIPSCQKSGKYEKLQCCEATGKCHCVNEDTGEKETEPRSGEVTCD